MELGRIGILSEMTTQDQPPPPGGFRFDSRKQAAIKAPTASWEDLRPQAIRPRAILKFQRPRY